MASQPPRTAPRGQWRASRRGRLRGGGGAHGRHAGGGGDPAHEVGGDVCLPEGRREHHRGAHAGSADGERQPGHVRVRGSGQAEDGEPFDGGCAGQCGAGAQSSATGRGDARTEQAAGGLRCEEQAEAVGVDARSICSDGAGRAHPVGTEAGTDRLPRTELGPDRPVQHSVAVVRKGGRGENRGEKDASCTAEGRADVRHLSGGVNPFTAIRQVQGVNTHHHPDPHRPHRRTDCP
ncbi:hypothetical protein HDC93_007255 [Streptomyces sp. AK010]|nr:hypothetical protein [Streptomyces sp. AK010]